MRRCTTISSLDEAESLSDAWLELADACGAGPFARPLFALTWWRHLGQGSLMVVAVHEDDQLVALAPLHQRRIGPVQVVRWLGHGLGTVAEALVRPGHDAAGDLLWSTAGARGRVLDLIECRDLGPLPGRRSAAPRYPVALQERDVCPVIDVHGDAEAHLADPACKRVRRTVRVARRRLTEAGHAFEVKVAHDTATLAALLPDVRRVFDVAEADRPRQHLLDGEWESFTSAIVREGAAAGGVLVLVAYVDDVAAAFDIVLLTPRTMSSWIGRFDPELAAFSPGHLLQCAGLDWADAHGYTTIDLLLGDSFYKRLWAGRSYQTLGLVSGPASARAILTGVGRVREKLRA
jgi:starch synthase